LRPTRRNQHVRNPYELQTDRNGTYLARYPHNDRFVGTRMPGNKYLKMDDRGAVDILTVDGVERIEGYSALPADSGGLVVSFGLDKAQVFPRSKIARNAASS
jgi:hypothetical protein